MFFLELWLLSKSVLLKEYNYGIKRNAMDFRHFSIIKNTFNFQGLDLAVKTEGLIY